MSDRRSAAGLGGRILDDPYRHQKLECDGYRWWQEMSIRAT